MSERSSMVKTFIKYSLYVKTAGRCALKINRVVSVVHLEGYPYQSVFLV